MNMKWSSSGTMAALSLVFTMAFSVAAATATATAFDSTAFIQNLPAATSAALESAPEAQEIPLTADEMRRALDEISQLRDQLGSGHPAIRFAHENSNSWLNLLVETALNSPGGDRFYQKLSFKSVSSSEAVVEASWIWETGRFVEGRTIRVLLGKVGFLLGPLDDLSLQLGYQSGLLNLRDVSALFCGLPPNTGYQLFLGEDYCPDIEIGQQEHEYFYCHSFTEECPIFLMVTRYIEAFGYCMSDLMNALDYADCDQTNLTDELRNQGCYCRKNWDSSNMTCDPLGPVVYPRPNPTEFEIKRVLEDACHGYPTYSEEYKKCLQDKRAWYEGQDPRPTIYLLNFNFSTQASRECYLDCNGGGGPEGGGQ